MTRPAGSAAALDSATAATAKFTPDVAGAYQASLTVTAGGLSSKTAVNLSAWPAIASLGHRVLDAAYSTAVDRVVMIF